MGKGFRTAQSEMDWICEKEKVNVKKGRLKDKKGPKKKRSCGKPAGREKTYFDNYT